MPVAEPPGLPAAGLLPAYLPSPSQGVWWLGPFPVRAYAMCILAGIVVATILTGRRLRARGGPDAVVVDIAAWAVPFGILGGRVYHVITDPELYFQAGRNPVDALKIWDGGLGIWGAVALGGVGAWIGCRRHGVRFLDFADAAMPPILLAQAIGRFGNYFNNELYGRPTTVPWALQVHCWDQSAGHAVTCPNGATSILGTFQPTFLYESIWCLLVAGALVFIDHRYHPARGRIFALYIIGYTAGRGVIESLRIDHANRFLGLRLNDWTAVLVFLLGWVLFVLFGRAARERAAHRGDPSSRTPGTAAADAHDSPAKGGEPATAHDRVTTSRDPD